MAGLFLLPVAPRKRKNYKTRLSVQNDYKSLFRFQEKNVEWIARHFLGEEDERRGGALSPKQKMEIFLRYLADPGFQSGVAEDVGVDRTTACKIIKEVLPKILGKGSLWIKFPQTEEQINLAKQNWSNRFHLPDCIGAIDCTHVRILKPSSTGQGDEFINRKNYPSINVQATCDASEKFTSVTAKWPGSVHDSRIFRNSAIYDTLKSNRNMDHYLVGDSGYGIAPWLLTPYKKPTNPIERNYNKIYAQDRVIIERAFGQLKSRFPMLGYKLRITLGRIPGFITSAFILHNVAKHLKDEDFDYEDPSPTQLEDTDDDHVYSGNSNRIRAEGTAKRARIANALF